MTINSSSQKTKSTSTSNRLVAIDYLKAIAIVLVIITHSITQEKRLKYYGPFWIDMAVPIFMIISGFTYSMSADRNKIKTLYQWFCWKSIAPKLQRIVLPYIIMIIIETIVLMLFSPKSIKYLLIGYVTGGWGPGSYYFPILIQFLVMFPLIFLIFKKSPVIAVVLTFVLHLTFDIVSNTLLADWPYIDWFYRLLIFRYNAFIVTGIALYYYREKIFERRSLVFISTILGAIYISMCNYCGYGPLIFSKWTVTSLPTVFWAFGLVVLGFKYLEFKNTSCIAKLFSTIGKASYHIFLTQMVYFNFLGGLSNRIGVEANVLICVIIGLIFYCFETFVLSNAC